VDIGLRELVLPTIAATTTLHPSVPPPVTTKGADQSNDTENSAFYSLDLIKPSNNRQMTLTRLLGWLAIIWIPYVSTLEHILCGCLPTTLIHIAFINALYTSCQSISQLQLFRARHLDSYFSHNLIATSCCYIAAQNAIPQAFPSST
jgi:hypothetical protein